MATPRPDARYAGLAGALALGVAVPWNIANVGGVARLLADEYGVGLAVVGLFTTALFLTHFLSQVPAGKLIDRFGARRVGLAALVVVAVANALALVAPELWIVLPTRLLMGFATAGGFIAGSDYVRALGGSSTYQGVYGGITLASPGLAVAVVPQLAGPLGWRAPFLSALVVAVAMAPFLAFAPADLRARRTDDGTPRTRLLSDRRLYGFAAIHVASFGLSVVLGNWVVTLLDEDGYSRSTAGLVGSLVLFAGVVTRPLGGWLLRRDPELARRSVAVSLAAGAASTLLLASSAPLPVLVLAAGLVGLAAGIPFVPAFVGAQATRPDAPGAAIGVVNSFAALTIVAGTPLLGLAFDPFGHGRAGFAAVALVWAAALLALPKRA